MNSIIAAIIAVGLLFGGFLLVRNYGLSEKVEILSVELMETQSALGKLRESSEDGRQDLDLKALADRMTRIEESAKKTRTAALAATASVDLTDIETQLDAHDEDIAQLKKDVKGSRQIGSAFDRVADRFLGGSDGESGDGERQSGLSRMLKARALFGKPDEELTEDERREKAELVQQTQRRRVEWTVSRFDRNLEFKLDDGQRDTLKDFLVEEKTALADLKGQEFDKETLEASQKQIKANTDARVGTILTDDQNASWVKYRSRSRSLRSFDRGRRSSRERESENE